jgi:anti-sigma factor RsiW
VSEIRPHQPGDLACVDVVELITDFLEGTLPEAERERIERHLETCPGCSEYLEQMSSLAGGLGGLREGLRPDSREGLIAAFREIRRDS